MAERNSFRSSSAKFRARQARRRYRKQRAEDLEWASKSGPVVIYHVDPASLVGRQAGYDRGKAAGARDLGKPAA